MLHNFLITNRTALIDRWRDMQAERSAAGRLRTDLGNGINIFLDQLTQTLTIERSDFSHGRAPPDVRSVAMLHGRDLFQKGFTAEQVVRNYGDICQAVTGLAADTGSAISAREFRTFNRCLDDAIAAAVTEFSRMIENRDHWETALTQTRLALTVTETALAAERRNAHEALTRSLHDPLTGLPTRELFNDRLAKAISIADRHNWTLAVMFLDLDQFKKINDTHGHATGDVVLKAISDRLLKYVRLEDTVCRYGGDEFLYLLINPQDTENVERIAKSLWFGIGQSVAVGDREFAVKPSIGIAIYPHDGNSGDELITNADAAMYRAKKHSQGVALFQRPNLQLAMQAS